MPNAPRARRSQPQVSIFNVRHMHIGVIMFIVLFFLCGTILLFCWVDNEGGGDDQDDIDPSVVPLPDCLCDPIKLWNQDQVYKNAGGHHLGTRQTWFPEIGHDLRFPCYFNVMCPNVPGVSSFYTTMFRSNGNAIHINRVVNNQSTFVDQPRDIGNLKCEEVSEGTYKWMFHGSPVENLSFACQADVESCSCPEIEIKHNAGIVTHNRFPGVPDQCSSFNAECVIQDQIPLLYSSDTVINNGAVKTSFYDDLMCIKTNGEYSWWYSNKMLGRKLSIGCGSVEETFKTDAACTCGAFGVMDSQEKLEFYDKKKNLWGQRIGIVSWEPSCQFNITCGKGYTGIMLTDNMWPLLVQGSQVKCAYNPLSNDLRMWVVDGVRVVNPRAGCFRMRL